MITVPRHLLDIFHWLLHSSFEATILLGLILLIRMAARRRFHLRMVYWLWVLLLIRLIWPLNLQTDFSIFNWIPRQIEPAHYLTAKTTDHEQDELSDTASDSIEPIETAAVLPLSDTQPPLDSTPLTKTAEPTLTVAATDPVNWLCTGWLLGVGVLGSWVLFMNFRLWRVVKRERLVTRQAILDLLEECKSQLDLQTVIGVAETDKVKAPCLFGYLRPRLLLPSGILDAMEPCQLRYVFLHELGHLKRHDILIGWLMAAIQVLHWFNPAVWFAMAQISRDRELACDELALSSLTAAEFKEYGSTILAFLQRFSCHQKLPAMAGIAENQSLLKRRITMIAQFKNRKISFFPVMSIIAIAILLTTTTFTTAQSDAEQNTVESPVIQTQNPATARPEILALDDGKSAGQKSIAGGGHVVWFEPEQPMELVAVRIYCSRYGTSQPPDENFYVWIADENQNVLDTFEFPYATIKRGNPKWYMLKTKPTKLPEKFYLCAGFNPEQTKGVYVHYDGEPSGHSYIGLPYDNIEFKPFDEGDWMIRAVVRPVAEKAASSGSLQSIIDAAQAGSTVEIPAGTYEESITINKSLVLKGASRNECILKVTADKPAIFIDTTGGKALVEDLTIQWQLASSDQHEYPFAVAVKDTKATISNCIFRPLGNPQRSPVAIRSMGFSDMTVTDCDFTGFDYVVCYGEGTKGGMQDCFIRNCGHQGVIVYSGAEANLFRNIITGSAYHAVRTTGGKLNMVSNLIINNRNRGVYLGNKSGSGKIVNNLLVGNATGIDGISACRFSINNNVILKSTYAAISARPYAQLVVNNNVLMDNLRGIIVQQEEGKSDPVQSIFAHNDYWNNETDVENCEKGEDAINGQPEFIDAANGNFTMTDPQFEHIGLSDPERIYYLWKKYKENI